MKFFLKKLGCPKNDVDGDYIAGRLIDAGHELSTEDRCGVVIVNTCGFILPAKEESINEILQYEKLKQSGLINRLYVTGCLSERYGYALAKELKGIDGVFGLGRIDDLVDAVNNNRTGVLSISENVRQDLFYISDNARFIDNSYPYEYLKIADGCDRYCSYCAIPDIRGKYRSRPIDEIVDEATRLVAAGKKEIILVSQEGTGYGRDLNNGIGIVELLKRIEKIDGLEWLRLMYLHPESVTDELIEFMSGSVKTLGYFDIPLQHISDKILKSMNRNISRKQIESVLQKIRSASSDNIIRTTFIAGLPGETDTEYTELKEFIEDFRFDRLGVFKYSEEEGTAAAKFAEKVPESVAAERVDELMLVQQGIAFEKNIALIGNTQKVIIDTVTKPNLTEGRTIGDCPEIDQTVYVRDDYLHPGDIINVRFTGADGYDLIAEPVK